MEKKVSIKEINKIRKEIEKEFPGDSALQEVHIARKIISKEAEIMGMSFGRYIMSLESKRRSRENKLSAQLSL